MASRDNVLVAVACVVIFAVAVAGCAVVCFGFHLGWNLIR